MGDYSPYDVLFVELLRLEETVDSRSVILDADAEKALQERVAERGRLKDGYWIPNSQPDKMVILSWSRK